MRILTFLVIATLFTSCGQSKKKDSLETPKDEMIPVEADGGIGDGAPSLDVAMINGVEKAHKKESFLNKQRVSFDIDLNFGGQDRLDGTITMLTNTAKIRIDKTDGSSLIFDNDKIHLTPKGAKTEGARFDMFTWPYFFSLPYKLSDNGVNVELKGNMPMDNDNMMNAFKMTFDAGTGDAPDDFYVVYTNTKSQIMGAGYIVTFGGTPANKAAENAHAIVYDDYKTIESIPIATSWKFYNWSAETGITGEPIGDATLTNVNFGKVDKSVFKAPKDSKVIE